MANRIDWTEFREGHVFTQLTLHVRTDDGPRPGVQELSADLRDKDTVRN